MSQIDVGLVMVFCLVDCCRQKNLPPKKLEDGTDSCSVLVISIDIIVTDHFAQSVHVTSVFYFHFYYFNFLLYVCMPLCISVLFHFIFFCSPFFPFFLFLSLFLFVVVFLKVLFCLYNLQSLLLLLLFWFGFYHLLLGRG